MKGANEMNTIINKAAAVITQSNDNCSSVSGISESIYNEVRYTYKVRKQKENSSLSGYGFTNKICRNTFVSNSESDGTNLYQIETDTKNDFVTIKFYLPESAKTKLILLNPDKSDGVYLINKKMKAGFHSIVTEIRSLELLHFDYLLELKSGGNSEVREMNFANLN
jgi:hypothetical protein